MKKISVRELKRTIGKLHKGDTVFVNGLGLTDKAIDALREFICEGVIEPEPEQLQSLIVPKEWCKYVSGECIAPQMEYIKM